MAPGAHKRRVDCRLAAILKDMFARKTQGSRLTVARHSVYARSVHRRSVHRRSAGFTLVEVMVVVVIAGVLALIGLQAMDKHLAATRSSEARAMVQSIRAAQERHRAMTGLYLDVSTEGGFYPRDPTGMAGTTKTAFFYPVGGAAPPDNRRWLELGPTVTGGVQYGYVVRAGLPGQAMAPLRIAVDGVVWPTPNEPWYVIEAIGDTDGDGKVSHFVATSLTGELYSENEGE